MKKSRDDDSVCERLRAEVCTLLFHERMIKEKNEVRHTHSRQEEFLAKQLKQKTQRKKQENNNH